MKKAYLDNAATTRVDPEVFQAMKPYLLKKYGNASEPHHWGQEARKAVETAREQISQFLGAKSKEIIFTGCATESINLAHKGLIEALLYRTTKNKQQRTKKKKPHIITSSIEHKAVLESCAHLERIGWAEVTYLPVNKQGLVDVKEVEKAIRP
jgi:cysteine desulfurase